MRKWMAMPCVLVALTVVSALLLSGCGESDPATTTAVVEPHDDHDHGAGAAPDGHTHGAWWCGEHGVPEGECARCDTSLIAGFKGKGDWCEEHARPDSQCFVCHPELEGKFAARYVAKYGEEPPKATE